MYLKFLFPADYGTTYKGDYCINLSDASINGKYYPYVKRMQSLDIIRKYFPDGMKSAGTAHDEIRYNKASGKWEAVQRIGARAYQEGDADKTDVLTDGKTTTLYELAEPIVTELDKEDQLRNFDYQVWNNGTEQAIAEGQTSPLKADIVYGFNAYGTIKKLKEQMATLMTQMAQMQTAMASVTSNKE